MSLNDEVELLRQVPIFANIEPAKLKLLAFTSERLTFRKGLDLCVQGDPGDAAFIIIEGEADIIIKMDNGDSKTVSKIGKHQMFLDLSPYGSKTQITLKYLLNAGYALEFHQFLLED